jgi:hypothetical protein
VQDSWQHADYSLRELSNGVKTERSPHRRAFAARPVRFFFAADRMSDTALTSMFSGLDVEASNKISALLLTFKNLPMVGEWRTNLGLT